MTPGAPRRRDGERAQRGRPWLRRSPVLDDLDQPGERMLLEHRAAGQLRLMARLGVLGAVLGRTANRVNR